MIIAFILTGVVSMLAAGGGVYFIIRALDRSRKQDAKTQAAEIVHRAEQDAENHRREVEIQLKEDAMRQKEKIDAEAQAMRQENHEKERLLNKRQDMIDKQGDDLRKQEKLVETNQRKLAEKIAEQKKKVADLQEVYDQQKQTLHELSGLSREQATERLLTNLETELQNEAGAVILRHEKKVAEQCQEQARNVLLLAIQRYAAAHTAEATTCTVDISVDDMKGRIIGREGRNIRAFEKVTGVDVIIDDTPGVVILSAFDSIRREVARLTLNRLITDGRIHPSRIEEIYNEANNEVQVFIQRAGLEAAQEVDVQGMKDRVVNLLGRLYFRTSFSQNVLRHSIEVAFISGLIAVELGLDERLARRCGLLHDIGKAVDHELEGGHPKIGADILKRYGEPPEVIQAALCHHDDARVANPYTVIVAAADACSASRPGARRETLEHYIKRMEELESIAMEFPSVEQAYAVQAGREMRILVNSGQSTDETAAKTCRDIVSALQERVQFPGEMTVPVIRETRTTQIAR
ncbi:MAG: ribonuclease Y [Planctomycetia bacterium]|nr:ribonuclease Y [Planctomycetia bacterium]